MYVRITSYKVNQVRIDEALAMAADLKPEIMKIPGILQWFDTGNSDGSRAVIAVYESKDAAESASERALELFGQFAQFMLTAPESVGYEVQLHSANSTSKHAD